MNTCFLFISRAKIRPSKLITFSHCAAYEKGHQRPALSVYTFQAPDRDGGCCHSQPASPVSSSSSCSSSNQQLSRVQLRRNNGGTRPPIPSRCSSLERPTIPMKSDAPGSPRGKPKLPLPAHLAKGSYSDSFTNTNDRQMYDVTRGSFNVWRRIGNASAPAANVREYARIGELGS